MSIYYNPQHFKEMYETQLGAEIWEFLNQTEIWYRLESASKLGHPAVEGIGENLYLKFGDEIRQDRIKQMVGHMIRQIMEYHGYVIDAQGVKCRKQNIFSTGTKYIERQNKIPYKNYMIQAKPNLLKTDEWTTSIIISRDFNNGYTEKPFYANNTFITKTEAVEYCIEFGRQIIDGKIKGCSVDF